MTAPLQQWVGLFLLPGFWQLATVMGYRFGPSLPNLWGEQEDERTKAHLGVSLAPALAGMDNLYCSAMVTGETDHHSKGLHGFAAHQNHQHWLL